MIAGPQSSLHRILVFRVGHLGDTVVAIPAFRALRNAFPKAEIVLLTNADNKNLHYISPSKVLPPNGLFDSYLTYNNAASGLAGVLEYLKLAAAIRSRKFDVLFYLMPRGRTPAKIRRDESFFWLAGIKQIYCTEYAKTNTLPQVQYPLPELDPKGFLIH